MRHIDVSSIFVFDVKELVQKVFGKRAVTSFLESTLKGSIVVALTRRFSRKKGFNCKFFSMLITK